MDSAAFCPLLLHSLLRGRAKIARRNVISNETTKIERDLRLEF